MSKQVAHITNAASYETYLHELFIVAVNSKATCRKSINEILLDQALVWGRTIDEAKLDIKHVQNIQTAFSIIIGNAAKAQYPEKKEVTNI